MAETKELAFPKDELEMDLESAFAELSEPPEQKDLAVEPEGEELEAEPSSPDLDEETDFEPEDEIAAEPAQNADLPPIEIPSRFNEEEKEAFKALPRQVQEAVSRIEKSSRQYLTSKTEELARTRQQVAPLESAMAPHRNYLEQRGITPERLVNEAVHLIQSRHSNPVGTLRELAAAWNVDPRQLIGEQDPATGNHSPDPYLLQLQQEVAGVKGLLSAQQNERQNRLYEQQYNAAATWRQERDESGKMLRPFLEMDAITGEALYPEFQARMVRELEVISSDEPTLSEKDLLERAYNNTMWLVPKAREFLEKQKTLQSVEQQKKRAKEARRASKSVTDSLGAGGVRTANGKVPELEDEIREFFNERGY